MKSGRSPYALASPLPREWAESMPEAAKTSQLRQITSRYNETPSSACHDGSAPTSLKELDVLYVCARSISATAGKDRVGVIRVIEDQITTLRPYNARYTGDPRSIFRKRYTEMITRVSLDMCTRTLPLLVPACLLLDGPADLPQMLPEGI